MRTIYLTRHCEYDLSHGGMPGRLPVELSEQGLLQATKLQQYFADKSIGCIYSSAVWRCKQTSSIISFGNIPIVYDSRLLETFSSFQGYWYDGEHLRDYFYGNREELGGESYSDVFSRAKSFYSDVIKKSDNIIVCSHGDILMMLYLIILGEKLPSDDQLESTFSKLGYQPKGAVRIVTFDKSGQFELQKLITF